MLGTSQASIEQDVTQKENVFPKVLRTERRHTNTQKQFRKKWIKAEQISPEKLLWQTSLRSITE
jgi:hypothetical protein